MKKFYNNWNPFCALENQLQTQRDQPVPSNNKMLKSKKGQKNNQYNDTYNVISSWRKNVKEDYEIVVFKNHAMYCSLNAVMLLMYIIL